MLPEGLSLRAVKEELEVHFSWREVYLGRRTLLREMPLIGWTQYHQAAPDLRAHTHEGVFEISLVVGGSVEWWAGDSMHEVRRGEVYITKPGEVHGGQNAMMQPCELYWLHVSIPHIGHLPGMSSADTRQLARDFDGMRLRKFRGSPMLADRFAQILAEHRERGIYGAVLSRAALHALLIQITHDHAQQMRPLQESMADPSPRIGQALQWIEQRLGEPWCVREVARAVGMGVSQFHKKFVNEVGLSPAAYSKRRRIYAAKARLRDGAESITGIAHSLGFASSQYFATAFANIVGMTPSDYRRRGSASQRNAEDLPRDAQRALD